MVRNGARKLVFFSPTVYNRKGPTTKAGGKPPDALLQDAQRKGTCDMQGSPILRGVFARHQGVSLN